MDEPIISKKEPFKLKVMEGETYFWCSCGLSDDQPLCDDAHEGTRFEPVEFSAEKDGIIWLCGCKRTKNKPFCDGSHSKL